MSADEGQERRLKEGTPSTNFKTKNFPFLCHVSSSVIDNA